MPCYFGALLAGMMRQRLGQLAWIDIPLVGIMNAAQDRVVGPPEGVHRLDFARFDHGQFETGSPGDTGQVMEQIHPLAGMCGPHGTGVAVGDGRGRIEGKLLVELPGIVSGAHARPRVGVCRNVAGGVPGGTGREFGFFDQKGFGDAGFCEMPENGRTDGAASDHNNLRRVPH